ncbi:hypothetical protein GCM10017778_30960 [Streptomyces vinaceus]|nr:hypothetical protein GCM10017778_30960 [Streptomyces vinaceus]
MEAEPPRGTAREDVLRSGQAAEQCLHHDQAPDEAGPAQREQDGGGSARIDADHRCRGLADCVEQPFDVGGEGACVVALDGAVTGAETSEVRGDDPELPGQSAHDVAPELPGVGEAVQQENRRSLSGNCDIELYAVRRDALHVVRGGDGHDGSCQVVTIGDHRTVGN